MKLQHSKQGIFLLIGVLFFVIYVCYEIFINGSSATPFLPGLKDLPVIVVLFYAVLFAPVVEEFVFKA